MHPPDVRDPLFSDEIKAESPLFAGAVSNAASNPSLPSGSGTTHIKRSSSADRIIQQLSEVDRSFFWPESPSDFEWEHLAMTLTSHAWTADEIARLEALRSYWLSDSDLAEATRYLLEEQASY